MNLVCIMQADRGKGSMIRPEKGGEEYNAQKGIAFPKT